MGVEVLRQEKRPVMPDLKAHQRATRLVADFMNAEFEDPQHVVQWLIDHIAAAIEDAERATRRRDRHRFWRELPRADHRSLGH